MSEHRENIIEYQNNLKFKHEDFPDDKYKIMHPNDFTAYADMLVLFEDLCLDTNKQVVIPVNRVLMEIIPYFKAQLNEKRKWREVENKNGKITKGSPIIIVTKVFDS